MNSHGPTAIALLLGLLLAVAPNLWAQPLLHHFTSISVLPEGTVTLSLDGSASNMFNLTGSIFNKFTQMFDLYLIDASTNLADWMPVASRLRTNSNANPLRVQDTNTAGLNQSFYRTCTNHLLTAFPKPSGPFAVGTIDRVMVDPARTNLYRYQPATNAFMVTFWYPAESPGAGVLPASAYDKRWAGDPTVYTSHGYSSAWTNIAPALVGHRFVGLPVAVNPGSYPVVLYSHGLTACRKLDSQRAEELASHGYVVVAPDHTDCYSTEFPDGRYLRGGAGNVSHRLKDMTFLLDELARLNASDPLFARRLDLDRLGVMGASYGGMVVETCRSDTRVKCAVLYDVTNVQLNPAGLQKPFLVALGASNLFSSEDEWLFSKAATNAAILYLRGADHSTGSDIAWLDQTPWGRGPAQAFNACALWLFDTYLKGETPPFPTNPEIYNLRRK